MTAMDDFVTEANRKMDKSVESAAHEFNTVRTGRASAALPTTRARSRTSNGRSKSPTSG